MGNIFLTAEVPARESLHLKNGNPTKLFDEIVAANPDLRVERTAEGEVIVMAPAHTRTGFQNLNLASALMVWAKIDGAGVAFDSSAGYDLPNGSNRGPDASWVLKSRLAALTPEQREKYFPLCPDFVIELRSQSDRLSTLKLKMEEYIGNGARLGWLIDPINRDTFIYRPEKPPEYIHDPSSLSGDPELPGFTLPLEEIWNPGF